MSNENDALLNDVTTVCAVCGTTAAALRRVSVDNLLGGTETFRAVRCVRCQTRRLDPRPSDMTRFYAPDTYARAEGEQSEVGKRLDVYNARVADRADAVVSKNDGEPRAALDVGCGDGRFIAALQARGWRAEGTETDPVAASLARRRTNAVIHDAPTEALNLRAASFDLVSLLHVLEHVSAPAETLVACYRLLKPGGALLLALPNAASREATLFGSAWYHLDLPRHLWGFTPHSLARLVEQTGFTELSIRYFPFLFAPQSGRNALRRLKSNRGAPNTGDDKPNEEGESGGGLQTRVFLGLLAASERAGRTFPGEIMELMAHKPDANKESAARL